MIKIQPSRAGYDSTCDVDEVPQQGKNVPQVKRPSLKELTP